MPEETFSNDLSNEERETHLNMTGDDHGTWVAFTDDPYWVRRFERAGAELIAEIGKGRSYRLAANQVTIRKARKPLTAAQKAKMAANLPTVQAKSGDAMTET